MIEDPPQLLPCRNHGPCGAQSFRPKRQSRTPDYSPMQGSPVPEAGSPASAPTQDSWPSTCTGIPDANPTQDIWLLPMCRNSGQHSCVDPHLPTWGSPSCPHLWTLQPLPYSPMRGSLPALGDIPQALKTADGHNTARHKAASLNTPSNAICPNTTGSNSPKLKAASILGHLCCHL